jgi:dipeptide/tripeptide permease
MALAPAYTVWSLLPLLQASREAKDNSISLLGIFATAQTIGGVAGPILSGVILQRVGFHVTFVAFAVLALFAAIIFQLLVPNTAAGT